MAQEPIEDGSLFRGMIFGLLLSIPIWAVITLAVWGLATWLL